MVAYIDHIVVIRRKVEHQVEDIKDVFFVLRSYEMKLHLEKCILGVSVGTPLSFTVT